MGQPQYKPTVIQDFSGGWNTKWALNASQLQENQSPYLKNVDYTSRFAFTKRRGISLVGNATSGLGSRKSLYTFTKRDGTEILMSSYGTVMQSLVAGTWTDITGSTGLTADLKFDFEVYKDTVYYSNGVDDFRSWPGTGSSTSFAGNPKATILCSAFLRLWAAGVTTDPALLYYTAPDDFTNFATAGAGNTSFQYAIKSLMPFSSDSGDELLQVYLLNGDLFHVGFDTSGTIYKKRVRRNVGSINHRASKQTENANFVLDTSNQVRGVGYEKYENDIRSSKKSVLIDSYMSQLTTTNASAGYSNQNYILSAQAPGASSNNVSVVYDENYSSWRLYDGFGSNQFANYAGKVAFASASDLNVYTFDSTKYSDNGIPINAFYQTRDINFEEELNAKTIRLIKIQGLISRGCSLVVKGYYDGQLTSTGFTKTISGNGPYVSSVPVSTFGSDAFGAIPFAGFGGTDSSITMYPFVVALSLGSTVCDSVRLEFSNTQKDVDFVVFSIKPYIDVLAGSRIPPDSII